MNAVATQLSAISSWSANARGAVWMFAGVLCFSVAAVIIKTVGQDLPTPMIVFFRCLFGLMVVVPLFLREGPDVLHIQKPWWHAARVMFALVGMSAGFYAVTQLELATAVSLGYTRPLFMIILAILFLGEVIRWRRGLATAIGFGGVLIVANPAAEAFTLAHGAALIGALSVACALAMVKQITKYDSTVSIMITFSVGSALVSAIPALMFWQWPSGEQWLLMAGLGIAASLGQFCWIRAFAMAEATVINPIDYFQLLLAAGFGFLLFNETPGWRTVIGAIVIVGSTLYIILREAQVKKGPPETTVSPIKE